jgi:peroxiredoxin Q/BCP
MPKLKPGKKAPAFALPDQSGRTVSLADFKGRMLLLYVYPMANTPGCTKQACVIRNDHNKLLAAGVAVVGISPDSPGTLQQFDSKYRLGFPLLSDPNHQVVEAYGALGMKSTFGKDYIDIIRSSFLIDGKGRIVRAWYKVKPEETTRNVLEALAKIKT